MAREDELYVVLIPDKLQIESVIKVQKAVSDYYNMYRDNLYPQLHITLDRIKKNKIDRALKIINKIIRNSGPVKIIFDKFSCFYLANDRHFVLKISKNESLTELANKIHDDLKKEDISTIDDYDDWIFHITIVNNKFADNPIPLDKFDNLCLFVSGNKNIEQAYAKRLEIWRPTLDPERKCIKSFKLHSRGDKN